MKTLAFVLLFVTVTFGQTIQEKVSKFEQAKEFGVKYDKFKRLTSVEVEMRLSTAKSTGWIASSSLTPTFILDIPDSGETVRAVYFFADRYKYFNQPTLRFLIDGEVITIQSDSISSSAVFEIPADAWAKLAAAKKLEMQLESKEVVFDEKAMRKLKNLDSLIK